MFLCQALRRVQLLGFKSNRFSQYNIFLDLKYSFSITVTNMNVNRSVLVTIKEEAKTILDENCWHLDKRQSVPIWIVRF